jgi:hypothetical protein
MRIIITLLIFLSPLIFLSAQPQKGNWILGAGTKSGQKISSPINHSSRVFAGRNILLGGQIRTNHFTNINIQPKIGYFVTDGLMAGIQLGFSYANISSSALSLIGYGIGPEIRHYFLKNSIRPYIGTSLLFSTIDINFAYLNYQKASFRINENVLGLYSGVAFFPVSNFSLDVNLEYNFYSRTVLTDSQTNSFNQVQLGLGFNYFF